MRTVGLAIASAVLGGLLVGALIFGIDEYRGTGKTVVVAPTAAPTSTVDAASLPPIHNAVQIVNAAAAQGWGPDQCFNATWRPSGVQYDNGTHTAPRIWTLDCILSAKATRAVCIAIDDETLEINAATAPALRC